MGNNKLNDLIAARPELSIKIDNQRLLYVPPLLEFLGLVVGPDGGLAPVDDKGRVTTVRKDRATPVRNRRREEQVSVELPDLSPIDHPPRVA